jgi:solute carrier family 9B (sodium/hydrogen exchanger), member 1/2
MIIFLKNNRVYSNFKNRYFDLKQFIQFEGDTCMLTSLALILIVGLLLGFLFTKLKFPSLLGMIFTGIILGPYVLNLIDASILSVSIDLRELGLIVILIRAGLELNIKELKQVGLSATLMCFIPAIFEIVACLILGPMFFGLTLTQSAMLGSVLGSVTPAVIVPRMIKLMQEGYGMKKSIPQLIMAGSSVDDIFVIVLFTAFISLETGGEISALTFLNIPISIISGVALGITLGLLISVFYKKIHVRDSVKVLVILSISFLCVALEYALEDVFAISGFLAVMSMSATILSKNHLLANHLSVKFSKLWLFAELLLFVLVGATLDIKEVFSGNGIIAIFVILLALIARLLGVYVILIKTKLNYKERLFCMLSNIPKATVQAGIGGVALSKGIVGGDIILMVAVLSIIITAPLGAMAIDLTYKKLLEK